MSRITRGVTSRARHKKILKQAKGFWGKRKSVFRRAKETILRAMAFAYVGRKLKKRDFRKLFITRINAGCRMLNLSYSVFINKLKKNNVVLNRKMLSQIATYDFPVFEKIVQQVV